MTYDRRSLQPTRKSQNVQNNTSPMRKLKNKEGEGMENLTLNIPYASMA
jgi:hypothetical protein